MSATKKAKSAVILHRALLKLPVSLFLYRTMLTPLIGNRKSAHSPLLSEDLYACRAIYFEFSTATRVLSPMAMWFGENEVLGVRSSTLVPIQWMIVIVGTVFVLLFSRPLYRP